MDELILEGRRTTDPEARKRIYSEVQRLIREDAPILPLYQQPNIYGLSKRIAWDPGLDEMIPVDTIKVVGP
jgi:peptide/nickel transport system substrate-binding protein